MLSKDSGIILGTCALVADKFGFDVSIVRLVMILLSIIFPVLLIPYIIIGILN